jgi:hypothetical protein
LGAFVFIIILLLVIVPRMRQESVRRTPYGKEHRGTQYGYRAAGKGGAQVQPAQPFGALLVGNGRTAGVPDVRRPDLGVVTVADDGHIFGQPCVFPQLCGQQDASLLVRRHLARGAEQIAGHSPAVHQLVVFQLVRQLFHFAHRQRKQAAVHPFQHHKALAHGVAEFCGEVQTPLGINGVVISAKKHLCAPFPKGFQGCGPTFTHFDPLIRFYCSKSIPRFQVFLCLFLWQKSTKKVPAGRRFYLQGLSFSRDV